MQRFAELTWTEVRDLDRTRVVAILPCGATEAHGPHLPLATDGVIAEAMAEAGARRLKDQGWIPLLLPTLAYTAAPFAAAFPGTLSLRPELVQGQVVDIGRSLAGHGFACLALANAHLDPAHVGCLRAAAAELRETTSLAVAFPDITRRALAQRLTEEFRSGACHAGRYEGSIVLAARPEWVRRDRAARLAANPASLSTAIRDGKASFEAAGGPEAYFGDPAAATAEEGKATLEILGTMLCEAVLEALAS
jgi:creatinine amidohydrolase